MRTAIDIGGNNSLQIQLNRIPITKMGKVPASYKQAHTIDQMAKIETS